MTQMLCMTVKNIVNIHGKVYSSLSLTDNLVNMMIQKFMKIIGCMIVYWTDSSESYIKFSLQYITLIYETVTEKRKGWQLEAFDLIMHS